MTKRRAHRTHANKTGEFFIATRRAGKTIGFIGPYLTIGDARGAAHVRRRLGPAIVLEAIESIT